MNFLFTILLFIAVPISSSAIDEVRNQFPNIDSMEQAQNYIELLKEDKSSEAKGYSAAMIFMKSRYVTFPFTKFKYFKDGKNELDAVINNKPKNIEIRYLRFLMQKQIPKFLGYHKNINEDFKLITKEIENSALQQSLKIKIVSNMLLVNNLTTEEKMILNELIKTF